MTGKREPNVVATMARAIELTEQALGQVARIAIEQIHGGIESSSHVEAAERDMRSALRQLVLAERELRSKPKLGAEPSEMLQTIVTRQQETDRALDGD